jgi:hypothetical protein
VENRDNFEFDDEKEKAQDSQYGDVPSMSASHTEIDTRQIAPTGTGCRSCFIFVLILGALLGFLYYNYQNQPQNQPIPSDTPPGQTRK